MKPVRTLVVAAIIAANTLAFSASAPAYAQDRACLSDREIYNQVEQGDILPLEDVLTANGIDRSTEILSVAVCESNGGLAYFVAVLNAYGEARTLVLPASE